MLYRFIHRIFAPWIVLPLFKLVNRLRVAGLEYIPAEGAAVIIANHISMWDPVILYCLIRRKAYYMAKSELFAIPLLGPFLRRICVFPVKRDRIDRTALRKASQVLEEGHVLTIFPEGHRSKTGEMQPFKQGAALFAHRSEAAVIPVLFENTQKAFPKSIGQKISVTVGPPLDLSAFYGKKSGAALLEEMTNEFRLGIASLKKDPEGLD